MRMSADQSQVFKRNEGKGCKYYAEILDRQSPFSLYWELVPKGLLTLCGYPHTWSEKVEPESSDGVTRVFQRHINLHLLVRSE